MKLFQLEKLKSPQSRSKKIELQNLSISTLNDLLKSMLKIRLVEKKLAKEKENKTIIGPVHLAIGQEAIGAGVSSVLSKHDMVFGTHRSHSHIIPMGSSLYEFFAEILGRKDGLCGGMGGSMHLQDSKNGFIGSVPIVAATVPLAVGAAISLKMDNKSQISVAYLGDGAIEEGIVHESFNLSSILNLPVVYVIENNLFASHMHIDTRQTQSACSRFAQANGIDYRLVDGNDVVAVRLAMKELSQAAKKDKKPGLIEAVTYRWLGHVDWREDIDVGVNRSKSEIELWKKSDPIQRLLCSMLEKKYINEDFLNSETNLLNKEIEIAWNKALKSPYPKIIPSALL